MSSTATPSRRYPTPEECYRILGDHGVPPHICRHSEQVARVVRTLAEYLEGVEGESVDADLLEAAALLHDIAKANCLESPRDHAAEGAVILRRLGLPEIAVLVGRHVHLGSWDRHGPVTEAELLNYGDKRVRHEEIVSLEERYLDLIERYGTKHPDAEARIRENWRVTLTVEEKIFERLPVGPECLMG